MTYKVDILDQKADKILHDLADQHLIVLHEEEETKPVAPKSSPEELTEFQKFLLTAPVMTDEEYEYIQEKRKHFNEWR